MARNKLNFNWASNLIWQPKTHPRPRGATADNKVKLKVSLAAREAAESGQNPGAKLNEYLNIIKVTA